MSLESIIKKISHGKEKDYSQQSSSRRIHFENPSDELAGLDSRELNYFAWVFLQEGSALKMRGALHLETKNFLSDSNKVSIKQRLDIVNLVLVLIRKNHSYRMSKREIARCIDMKWSTFSSNKMLYSLIAHLLTFCSHIEGNIEKKLGKTKRINELMGL